MNRALKSALIELRSDGVNLDPVTDLEHILTLDRLSRKITEPANTNDTILLRPVLRVGNVNLWPLSLGAQRFLSDVVAVWIPEDVREQDLAYMYCMCHEPEDLWILQNDRATFLAKVKEWTKGINVPMSTLSAAVQEYLSATSDGEKSPSKALATPGDYRRAMGTLSHLVALPSQYRDECEAALIGMETEVESGSYGPLIEALCRDYGHDADHWLWRVSSKEIGLLMSARNEKLEAEARAIKGAQDDRMQRAHHAFTQYVELVRRIKKGTK